MASAHCFNLNTLTNFSDAFKIAWFVRTYAVLCIQNQLTFTDFHILVNVFSVNFSQLDDG